MPISGAANCDSAQEFHMQIYAHPTVSRDPLGPLVHLRLRPPDQRSIPTSGCVGMPSLVAAEPFGARKMVGLVLVSGGVIIAQPAVAARWAPSAHHLERRRAA